MYLCLMISLNVWNDLEINFDDLQFEETTQNGVTDTLMKESVLAVFSFVEWYHWETYPFLFQFYLCNMASMVYNSWTKIGMPELIAVINVQAALCLLGHVSTHHNREHWYNLMGSPWRHHEQLFYPFLPVYMVVRIAFLSGFCESWLTEDLIKKWFLVRISNPVPNRKNR